MADRDLYAILGVSRTATTSEIKKSYRKLARELHPDRNPGNKTAEERFKDVSFAYEVLSDSDKRSRYDEFGEMGLREGFNADAARQYKQWQSAEGTPNWGDQFEDVFRGARHVRTDGAGGGFSFNLEDLLSGMGGGMGEVFSQARSPRGPAKSPDMQAELTISFSDALSGGERDLHLSDGAGGRRSIKARFPAGVHDGGKLRLRGQGVPGGNGQPAGDLVLTVRVSPHPVFWREGDDLHLDLPITPAEAYRGGKVQVPTTVGSVMLTIPTGSQSGATLRVKGKGAPVPGKKNQHGDLYAHLLVTLPKDGDETIGKMLDEVSAAIDDVRSHIKW